jgi:hypothetical protein
MRIKRIIDIDQIGQQRTGRLVPVAATFVTGAHVTSSRSRC